MERYYGGYARDSRRILRHITDRGLDDLFLAHALSLVQTYANMARSGPSMDEIDGPMLALACRIGFRALQNGSWDPVISTWPKLRNTAMRTQFSFAYVSLTCTLAIVEDKAGHVDRARELFSELLDSPVFGGMAPRVRCNYLFHAGTFYLWQGEQQLARRNLEEALTLTSDTLHETDDLPVVDPSGVKLTEMPWPVWGFRANTLNQLGNLAMFEERFADAESIFDECLALIAEYDGLENMASVVYQSVGRLYLFQQRYAEAKEVLQRGLHIRKQRQHIDGIISTSIYLAGSLLGVDQIEAAEDLLHEVLERCMRHNIQRDTGLCHLYLGKASWLRGDRQPALDHWRVSAETSQRIPYYRQEFHALDEVLTPTELAAVLADFRSH
ncbi:MAG: tetratricopeptide repeat protein [Caldilineaceae bacterium]